MILEKLDLMFPKPTCELIYHNPFEFLIAVVLSAQTTDASVNRITPTLFKKYPNPLLMSQANDLEEILKTLGLYRHKAKAIKGISTILSSNSYDLSHFEELIKLPGVGRKTANVFLKEIYNIPTFAIDTHVKRVAIRLRLANPNDSVFRIEEKLCELFPKDKWNIINMQLLYLGRYICIARKPKCDKCLLKDYCFK